MGNLPHILSISVFLLIATSVVFCDVNQYFTNGLKRFSDNLFNQLSKSHKHENLIISPYSIQTSLAIVRMGADGDTASEMDTALQFNYLTPSRLAHSYFSLLAKYENSNNLHMANKIYVNHHYQLQDTFKQLISKQFYASAESIDFTKSGEAADAMNAWVSKKTNQLINNVVNPDMMSSDTASFLLSAIHFDGKWETEFPVENTTTEKFYIDDTNTVDVQMMKLEARMQHWYVARELRAEALLLPYKDSDLSMLILLPSSPNGLAAMLEKMKDIELGTILTRKLIGKRQVALSLPKFKIDMELDLIADLKELGLTKLFEGGSFNKMLKSVDDLHISKVIHKAFIEVNELGTKAAAVTIKKHSTRGTTKVFPFKADHPFYFMIVNKDYVPFFQGTVVNF